MKELETNSDKFRLKKKYTEQIVRKYINDVEQDFGYLTDFFKIGNMGGSMKNIGSICNASSLLSQTNFYFLDFCDEMFDFPPWFCKWVCIMPCTSKVWIVL